VALAKAIGCSAYTLEQTFRKYNEAARTKNDPFDKKFFNNAPFVMKDTYHVGVITPIVHYTMGGIKITTKGEGVGPNGVIPGLFGAGEVCGGIHGKNRLGGSSLLDCVVFGRVSGASAARYLFTQLLNAPRGAALGQGKPLTASVSTGNAQTTLSISPETGTATIEIRWGDTGDGSADDANAGTDFCSPATND